jgi:GntR family transcriptional regulator, transcriptional repressor for pyruvate dehydrogenase complex
VTEEFADLIRTPRTFEAAIEEILAGIARARLRRGDRLPLEGELARQLGISKPTLRQALRVLERSEVLAVRPGKGGGIFVASDLLPYDVVSANVGLETENVREILRGRRILETGVVHEASATATAADFAELQRTIRLLEEGGAGRKRFARADAMFHQTLAHASHNRLLAEAMRLVARQLAPLRDMLLREAGDVDRMVDIHTRQLRAMHNRERDALDSVLDEHFRLLEDRFAESLGQTWDALFGATRVRPAPPFEPAWQKLARLRGDYRART